MGEMADMMFEGHLCDRCGVYMTGGCGYPQRCADCIADDVKRYHKRVKKARQRARAKRAATENEK